MFEPSGDTTHQLYDSKFKFAEHIIIYLVIGKHFLKQKSFKKYFHDPQIVPCVFIYVAICDFAINKYIYIYVIYINSYMCVLSRFNYIIYSIYIYIFIYVCLFYLIVYLFNVSIEVYI